MEVRDFYSRAQIMAAGETALRARMVANFNKKEEDWGSGLVQTPSGIMVRRKAAENHPVFFSSKINGDMNRGRGFHATAQKDMNLYAEVHGSPLASR
jgi:hypothetical protein